MHEIGTSERVSLAHKTPRNRDRKIPSSDLGVVRESKVLGETRQGKRDSSEQVG